MYTWSIVLLLVLVSNARAEVLPSQVDLRAAYCIRILQETLSDGLAIRKDVETYNLSLPTKEVVEKKLSETATNLRRLQLYLLPRLSYLDSYGVGAAKKSGDEDIVRVKELAKTCDAKCRKAFPTKPSAGVSCMMDCQDASP